MNLDPKSTSNVTTFVYDARDRQFALNLSEGPEDSEYTFEHDKEKGVFRLRWSDGEVEVFRDKPVRHLVLEPDPETGEFRPVVKRGRPAYLHLSREEREVR